MAGALEIAAASLEDSLINSMSFHGRSTASYIIWRRSTAYVPLSGDTFSPANTRIIRFSLNDSDGSWLDGSSIRLGFNFRNSGPTDLQPNTSSPSSLFRRIRVLVGGVEIYDCLYAGRVHEMFALLMPPSRRMNDAIEGWQGNPTNNATLDSPMVPAVIPKGKSRRMMAQILCGFSLRAKCVR